MTGFPSTGEYYLKPGLQLVPEEKGGTVIDPQPLKVLRLNPLAFSFLQKCRTGYSFGERSSEAQAAEDEFYQPFIDALCQAGMLIWQPETGYQPLVSIIVPVFNRAHEIGPCLESLLDLDYPAPKLEIIVVDDASTDGTPEAIRKYPVHLIVQPENQGPSAARNAGFKKARGEILAFIDSDCLAEPTWLNQLVIFFQDPRLALVGGVVDAYYHDAWLDRYEEVRSPLNMGPRRLIGASRQSDIFVPSCNMLVRKQAYAEVGGLDENRLVGEDVDLCWRLKEKGHRIIYLPQGRVRHKHRNRFWPAFKRRFDYGTSEPSLYARHREVAKRFPWQPGALSFFLLICLALLTFQPYFLGAAILIPLLESWLKKRSVSAKSKAGLSWGLILSGTLKAYFQFIHHLTYYLLRYYLLIILLGALLFPTAAILAAGLALFPALVDFFSKKPRLPGPVFLLFYWLEQAFYQTGVMYACLKEKSLRCHRVTFSRVGLSPGPVGFFTRRQKTSTMKLNSTSPGWK